MARLLSWRRNAPAAVAWCLLRKPCGQTDGARVPIRETLPPQEAVTVLREAAFKRIEPAGITPGADELRPCICKDGSKAMRSDRWTQSQDAGRSATENVLDS